MKKSTLWETIGICFIVSAGIVYLRLNADYPEMIVSIIGHVIKMAEELITALGLFEIVQFFQKIPVIAIILILSIIQILLGLIFLAVFRRPMEQGTMILAKRLTEVIKFGLTLYFCFFTTSLLFLYSIIGIPLAAAIIIVMNGIISIGNVPVAIYLGWLVGEWIGIRKRISIFYLLGSFMMMICESVFGVGNAFLFFVFPVLALGTSFLLFLDRCINGMRFPFDSHKEGKKSSFDRNKIKQIIEKGLEEKKKED